MNKNELSFLQSFQVYCRLANLSLNLKGGIKVCFIQQKNLFHMFAFKSPVKVTAKSLSSRSCTSKAKSKISGLSPLKDGPQGRADVFNSQFYKNVLSRLLSKKRVEEFLQQTSKFIVLDDKIVESYSKWCRFHQSNQQFPELGKALIRDGSFICHYCRVLTLREPQREQQFKAFFYENYKNKICEKKPYFQNFFKREIKDELILLSQSNKKMCSKKKIKDFSSNKSVKNSRIKVYQSEHKEIQIPKACSNISVEDLLSNEETVSSTDTFRHPKTAQSAKQSHQLLNNLANLDEEEESLKESSYVYRSSNRFKNETEQQRERRLLGLVGKSSAKSCSKKKVNCVVKFVDQVQANERLKQIYESVKKQRAEMQQKQSTAKKCQQVQFSPVYRPSYRQYFMQLQKNKIFDLSMEILAKLSAEEREVLVYFPKIIKFAIVDTAKKDCQKIVGCFKGKVLMKCFITDILQFSEPTYVAIYLQQIENIQKTISDFDFQIDETAEVILISEFRPEFKNE